MKNRSGYSNVVVLTGAGASKACGLPDMVGFAQQFKDRVEMKGSDSPPARLVREILSLGGPQPDLESLMSTLTALSSEGTDPAVNLLLSEAVKSEKDLTEALGASAEGLSEWVDRAPLGDGPFDVVRRGAVTLQPTTPSIFSSVPRSVLSTNDPSIARLSGIPVSTATTPISTIGGISKSTVDAHRKSASRARAVAERWRGRFATVRPVASELLQDLKVQIQKTYSEYNIRRAVGVYWPLFEEIFRRIPHLDVFTLNYDTVIERVVKTKGRKCFTGFPDASEAVWRDSFPRPEAAAGSIRLFKLHGSVTGSTSDGA